LFIELKISQAVSAIILIRVGSKAPRTRWEREGINHPPARRKSNQTLCIGQGIDR